MARMSYIGAGQPGQMPGTAGTVYRTAVYARLSVENSGKQDEGNSIRNQIDVCREYIDGCPYLQLTEIYSDDGYSGVNFERPSFQKMMQDIREKKIDCIIVKDLSRFGRNYIDVGKYIEQLFPVLGVRFIAINDNYDSLDDTANNSIILSLIQISEPTRPL